MSFKEEWRFLGIASGDIKPKPEARKSELKVNLCQYLGTFLLPYSSKWRSDDASIVLLRGGGGILVPGVTYVSRF